MKTITTISLIVFLSSSSLFAHHKTTIRNKDVDGIFTNYIDYKKRILSCQHKEASRNESIKLKQFFISPEILCIKQTEKSAFLKDSIFAIHLFNGDCYRFINRTPCFIADTMCLYIYEFETTKLEYKISGPHRREYKIPVTYYYFSYGDHKVVYPLTLRSLSKYPNIYTIVCNKFQSDEMLKEINPKTGHFIINETLAITLK
jgi:hypothetical protein